MRSPGLPRAIGLADSLVVVVRLSQIARGVGEGCRALREPGAAKKNLPMALEPPTPANEGAVSGASVQAGSTVRVLGRSPSGSRLVAMPKSRDFAQ